MLLILVDQLERVFAAGPAPLQGLQRLFAALTDLLAGGRVVALALCRNDFYPRIAEVPALVALKSGSGVFDLALLNAGELPTAVFCGNDETAIGLIHRMRQAGIECPRDISVVGFDDIGVSSFMAPPLTTMRQPREEIGRLATEAVIDIIEGARREAPFHLMLSAELIVRQSTAPLRP